MDGEKAVTLAGFVTEHNVSNDGQRLGQRFVKLYISQPWPELFYEESDRKALKMIGDWLTENHYFGIMPPLAKKRS